VEIPVPTPIYRLIHIDNLEILLHRNGLHAPHATPDDGLIYKTIHNVEIQAIRKVRPVFCGPGGTVHDYVPFYFGYLSPMLLKLKSGQVDGYNEGQKPLIYLVSSVQNIAAAEIQFIFSDGHGITALTKWYDDMNKLDQIDWEMVYQRYWKDNLEDMDRKRRKQAEFLVHRFCPWALIAEIAVINESVKMQVEAILSGFDEKMQKLVAVKPEWFYY
jgi:hypothetical protein